MVNLSWVSVYSSIRLRSAFETYMCVNSGDIHVCACIGCVFMPSPVRVHQSHSRSGCGCVFVMRAMSSSLHTCLSSQ